MKYWYPHCALLEASESGTRFLNGFVFGANMVCGTGEARAGCWASGYLTFGTIWKLTIHCANYDDVQRIVPTKDCNVDQRFPCICKYP